MQDWQLPAFSISIITSYFYYNIRNHCPTPKQQKILDKDIQKKDNFLFLIKNTQKTYCSYFPNFVKDQNQFTD